VVGVAGTFTAGSTATIPGVGTLVINANGSYTFDPVNNYYGPLPTTTYQVSDGTTSTTSTLNITVTPVNDPPIALPESLTSNEDTPVFVNLTGSDLDGTITSVSVTTLPPVTQGILTLANGAPITAGQILTSAEAASLIFKPALNFVGSVNIEFTVTDNSGGTSAPVLTTVTFEDVVSPPTANPLNTGGAATDLIPLPLGGLDADGTISFVTIKALPPALQGVLTLSDGTPVNAGQTLTPTQAAGLIFKPNPGFNGVATILFTVTDDEGLESAIAGAEVKLIADSGLFEQLQSNPIKFDSIGILLDEFAIRSPVLPIGMPENLFVTHSVRESQNQVAQNSMLGVFNADTQLYV
jgi:VCBS repeat-containing protein